MVNNQEHQEVALNLQLRPHLGLEFLVLQKFFNIFLGVT